MAKTGSLGVCAFLDEFAQVYVQLLCMRLVLFASLQAFIFFRSFEQQGAVAAAMAAEVLSADLRPLRVSAFHQTALVLPLQRVDSLYTAFPVAQLCFSSNQLKQ